jgi:hypothetical protein
VFFLNQDVTRGSFDKGTKYLQPDRTKSVDASETVAQIEE